MTYRNKDLNNDNLFGQNHRYWVQSLSFGPKTGLNSAIKFLKYFFLVFELSNSLFRLYLD